MIVYEFTPNLRPNNCKWQKVDLYNYENSVCDEKKSLLRYFCYLSVQLEAVSIFCIAYSHACKTKEEKDTFWFAIIVSIFSIKDTGNRIVLFSVSFLSGFNWNAICNTSYTFIIVRYVEIICTLFVLHYVLQIAMLNDIITLLTYEEEI